MQALASSQCSFHKSTCLQRVRAQPVRQAAVKQCTVAKAKTKAGDFRRLTDEQIDEEVVDAQVSLYYDFRYLQATAKSGTKPKPQLKWDLETKIAQLLTVKRERELENKVSKRASRSLQRNKNVLAGFGKI